MGNPPIGLYIDTVDIIYGLFSGAFMVDMTHRKDCYVMRRWKCLWTGKSGRFCKNFKSDPSSRDQLAHENGRPLALIKYLIWICFVSLIALALWIVFYWRQSRDVVELSTNQGIYQPHPSCVIYTLWCHTHSAVCDAMLFCWCMLILYSENVWQNWLINVLANKSLTNWYTMECMCMWHSDISEIVFIRQIHQTFLHQTFPLDGDMLKLYGCSYIL